MGIGGFEVLGGSGAKSSNFWAGGSSVLCPPKEYLRTRRIRMEQERWAARGLEYQKGKCLEKELRKISEHITASSSTINEHIKTATATITEHIDRRLGVQASAGSSTDEQIQHALGEQKRTKLLLHRLRDQKQQEKQQEKDKKGKKGKGKKPPMQLD